MKFSAIERIYGNNVLNYKKTIDQVPEKIRENVREYVLSVNPKFFDVAGETEEPVEKDEEPSALSQTTPSSSGGGDGTDTVS